MAAKQAQTIKWFSSNVAEKYKQLIKKKKKAILFEVTVCKYRKAGSTSFGVV